MIKAIFFDLTGVLLQDGFRKGIRQYEENHSISEGELYRSIHDYPHWEDFKVGNIKEAEFFQKAQEHFTGHLDVQELKDVMFGNFLPNKELLAYIDQLKNSCDIIFGIICNNSGEWFDQLQDKFPELKRMEINAVSGHLHMKKPDKDIFQWALQRASVKADEAIFIDDREKVTTGAIELGIKTIIYRNFGDLAKELEEVIKK